MMNREVSYDRSMTGSYMKIPVGESTGLDEKLILRRKLQGALPVEKMYVDENGQYWYNISGRQSLDTYCGVKEIGIDFVERLVVSICNELEIMEQNLIHANCLMLEPEFVFITNSNGEFIFTLYPGNDTPVETAFQQLMEYLLTKVDHKDDAAVRAAYAVYEKTLVEGYSIMDIRESIMKQKQRRIAEEGEKRVLMEKASMVQMPSEPDTEDVSKEEPEERTKLSGLSDKLPGLPDKLPGLPDKLKELLDKLQGLLDKLRSFFHKGESPVELLVYPEEEAYIPQEPVYPTECLNSRQAVARGILLYQGEDGLPDIPIDADMVKIGHGAEADAQINRTTISQLHARIDREQDNYYIEDLNSTNGTYVNEEALVYKERRQLMIDDIVCFADVRYRFC